MQRSINQSQPVAASGSARPTAAGARASSRPAAIGRSKIDAAARPKLPHAAAVAVPALPAVQPTAPLQVHRQEGLNQAVEFQLVKKPIRTVQQQQQQERQQPTELHVEHPLQHQRRQASAEGGKKQQKGGSSGTRQRNGSQPSAAGAEKRRKKRRSKAVSNSSSIGSKAAVPASPVQPAAAMAAAGLTKEARSQRGQQRRQQRKQPRPAQVPAGDSEVAASTKASAPAAMAGKKGNGKSSGTRKEQPLLQITPKDQDLMRWYADVVQAAESAAKRSAPQGAAAATYGSTLQEPMQAWLNERLDYMGFEPRSFPQLTPLDSALLSDSSDNDEPSRASSSSSGLGGSGDSTLEEEQQQRQAAAGAEAVAGGVPAAVASDEAAGCTSRTFARWVRSSGGSLPLLASQWHNVHSGTWELHNPGLLLHEGHAAHEWTGAAEEHAKAMVALYEEFARDVAGLPAIAGRRSTRSTLWGAAATYTVQAMVADGRALQVGQSHHLADNYSRALGASYSSSDEGGSPADGASGSAAADGEEPLYMSQMGSGLQASLLGGVVLAHGDDAGLRLPPALAPVQVVVTPVFKPGPGSDRQALADEAERIRGVLATAGVRVAVDDRKLKPAVRFRASEHRGVPLRIEITPADLAAHTCTIARRSEPGPAGKLAGVSTEAEPLALAVLDLLDSTQSDLRWRAAEALETNIVDVSSFMELQDVIEAGKWARGPWAGSIQDELAVQEETGASLLCFPLQQPVSMWSGYHTCLYSGYQASEVAIFARPL